MNQYTGIYRRCELLYIRGELERYGLQPLEGKMLSFLKDNCCTQEDVCAHFDMDKGRIARSLSEMEERGLVRRYINEKNKRQKLVSLTDEGGQVLEGIYEVFRHWDDICYAGFSQEERELHQEFQRRIAGNVTEYRHGQGEGKYGKQSD